jgi:hypothetical protein
VLDQQTTGGVYTPRVRAASYGQNNMNSSSRKHLGNAKHTAHFAPLSSGTKPRNRSDNAGNSQAQLLAEWVCHEEGIVSLQVQYTSSMHKFPNIGVYSTYVYTIITVSCMQHVDLNW